MRLWTIVHRCPLDALSLFSVRLEKTIRIIDNELSPEEDKKAKEILRSLEGITIQSIYRILNIVEANVVVFKSAISEESPLLEV